MSDRLRPVVVRPIDGDDRPWLEDQVLTSWGLPVVSVSGPHDPRRYDGLVATVDGRRVGALTSTVDDAAGGGIEVVTLDSLEEGRGVGGALLAEARRIAGDRHGRLWLITTDENGRAIGFYRRRGMDLRTRHRGFADTVRQFKPAAVAWGAGGAAYRDALEFEYPPDPSPPALTTSAPIPGRAGSSPVLRPAHHADAGAAAEVILRSRGAAAIAGSIPALVHDDADVRRWFGGVVARSAVGPIGAHEAGATGPKATEVWVAEVDGACVGVMALAGGWIDQLYLDPLWSGRGIGATFVTLARRRRPDGLQLWTFETNAGAQRFYDRHGFAVAERTDGAGNEERSPDVRFVWTPDPGPPRAGSG